MGYIFLNVLAMYVTELQICLGHLNGVVARIQKEPKAHYFHCVAHSPNLCLQDCGQNCMTIHKALTVTIELALIIHASPKCLAQFWHLNV